VCGWYHGRCCPVVQAQVQVPGSQQAGVSQPGMGRGTPSLPLLQVFEAGCMQQSQDRLQGPPRGEFALPGLDCA
jgi:hypothetical protein